MPTWRPPGVRALATYKRAWLRQDIVAGLVLSTLLVPQGMAYAELAGLPPITGLYTTRAVPARLRRVRAVADPRARPRLVAGPDDRGDDAADPGVAAATRNARWRWRRCSRCWSGVIMIVAGVARLGFIADLLSKPTQIGYMNGLALTILIGQLPKLFGFSVDADGADRRGARVRATGSRRARWSAPRSPSG